MYIECVICLENLQVIEDIYSTPCGHVFHSLCISQWFERSSTCPECRKEVPDKKLTRIFFNFLNENTIMEQFTFTLESEIKSLRDQLMVKDEVIKQGIAKEQDLYEMIKQFQKQHVFLITNIKDHVGKLEELTVKYTHCDELMDALEGRLCEIFQKFLNANPGHA